MSGSAESPPPRVRLLAAVALLLSIVIPVGGVVAAVRGLTIVHRSARGDSIGLLSAAERRALGASNDALTLWSAGAAPGLSTVLQRELGRAAERVVEIDLFSDHALIAVARGSDGVDHYEWSRGRLDVVATGPGNFRVRPDTFSVGEVPWGRLGMLMMLADIHLGVDNANAQYIQMDAGALGSEGLTLRLYTSGPGSRGGYLEADGSGRVRRINAD